MKIKSIAIRFLVLVLLFRASLPSVSAQQGILTSRVFPYGIVSYGNGLDGKNFTHHIDGYVRKKGGGFFLFPTGSNSSLRPFATYADGIYGAYFQADPSIAILSDLNGADYPPLPNGAPFSRYNKDSNIQTISDLEYWDINGANPTRISLTWDIQSRISELTNGQGLEKLLIVGWNGERWEKIPSMVDPTSLKTGETSNMNSGSITTEFEVVPDSYNVYTLGVEAGGALPVELVNFRVVTKENKVILNWTTVSERNFDYFEVEKSQNGKAWSSLGKLDGNGNSTNTGRLEFNYRYEDLFPFSGTNLYRLKMLDLDKSFAYSSVKSAYLEDINEVVIYPNPATQRFFVKSDGGEEVSEVSIYNTSGHSVLYEKSVDYKTGFDVSHIPSGIYLVKLRSFTGSVSSYPLIISK